MNVGRSLAETPTWSVATVTTVLVGICFIVERSIHRFGEWLARTKRKPLLAALTKIKEELMLLGLMSLLLSQSARLISGFCVKSSLFSSKFYPCSREDFDRKANPSENDTSLSHLYPKHYQTHFSHGRRLAGINYCSKGHEPFVSYESLEQLHRFLFILGVTHVFYCCLTMLFAMIKIYSWRPWEIEAHSRLIVPEGTRTKVVMRRQTTFVFHHTAHPWSKNRILVWVLCFARQFIRSVTKADYRALRLGFITNHRLRLTYDFHSYMVRTMEDEFRDIVGISWPLWGYAIICIFFNLHGLNFYFWISFIPAMLILFVGTKLQHVIAKLALDNAATDAAAGTQLKPRDELFWFGKPQLLLWLIQFISFQNAFEMAAFVWSWGISSILVQLWHPSPLRHCHTDGLPLQEGLD
ncbi:MLO-like protein 4 isoform X2 [Cryptomeria japonica]|uniref:MLO-like protein 4 isoform X2 n=1 Tax=Cryptomeria japonica TaxID=3369 RepID=UPI0025AD1274|nr:MLO-like protein 4 isoform X2 [Cryptomeria japonica]